MRALHDANATEAMTDRWSSQVSFVSAQSDRDRDSRLFSAVGEVAAAVLSDDSDKKAA